MNEEIQKGHQVAADFHEDSSDSGKILTRRNKDLLLPHCGLLFFFLNFLGILYCVILWGFSFLLNSFVVVEKNVLHFSRVFLCQFSIN